MQFKDLEARNNATLAVLREMAPLPGDIATVMKYPYYGFYEVDIFDCPPFVMFTANDCPRAWNILFQRYFEPYSMKLWCRMARTATGILDIGAHVGVYSLAAAAIRNDIPIHAFEPNPYAFSRLRIHKLVNGFSNIEENTVAVGDAKKLVRFGWGKKPTLQISSGGQVDRQDGPNIETTFAPMIALDDTSLHTMIGERGLVKIDVEGGEVSTIKGMRKILARRPNIILETFHREACDAINEIILPLGYRTYRIVEKDGQLISQDKLYPCDPALEDFNQLLTVHQPHQLGQL